MYKRNGKLLCPDSQFSEHDDKDEIQVQAPSELTDESTILSKVIVLPEICENKCSRLRGRGAATWVGEPSHVRGPQGRLDAVHKSPTGASKLVVRIKLFNAVWSLPRDTPARSGFWQLGRLPVVTYPLNGLPVIHQFGYLTVSSGSRQSR